MSTTERTTSAVPYEIRNPDNEKDLLVVEIDAEEAESICIRFPRQTRGLSENLRDWIRSAEERGEKLWLIRVRWQDDGLRRPNGLTIKGIEVRYAAFGGNLIGADLNSPTGVQNVARYVRLSDPGKKQWDILVYWTTPDSSRSASSFCLNSSGL